MARTVSDHRLWPEVDLGHQGLDGIGPTSWRHQNQVVARDHHQIIHADDADRRAIAAHVVAPCRNQRGRPLHDVAGIVLFPRFPDGAPGSEIGPIEIRLDHDCASGLLHHGMVEGDAAHGRERPGESPTSPEPAGDVRHRRGDSLVNVWRVGGKFGLCSGHRHHEVTAVPEIAVLEVAERGLGIRLLDKGPHSGEATGTRNWLPRAM